GADHELPQRRVEGLVDVLGVVAVGELAVDGPQLHGVDGQALALEPADDLPDQSPTHRVRLDQDQGALAVTGGGHRASSAFPRPAGAGRGSAYRPGPGAAGTPADATAGPAVATGRMRPAPLR